MAPTFLLVLAFVLPLDCGTCSPPRQHAASRTSPVNVRDHLRPLDPAMSQILQRGLADSPTMNDLAARLEQRDVIVYLGTAIGMPTRGALTFMAAGGPVTYLLIRVDLRQSPAERAATLAHELTHAVETAEACPPVRSDADLAALYRMIGRRGGRADEFESPRAVANEATARGELSHAAPRPER